jgi:hypothetical protein
MTACRCTIGNRHSIPFGIGCVDTLQALLNATPKEDTLPLKTRDVISQSLYLERSLLMNEILFTKLLFCFA